MTERKFLLTIIILEIISFIHNYDNKEILS